MKKIDFHIHTISTMVDYSFVFSLDRLKDYINYSKIDAIAITNHNMFDKKQYLEIKNELQIPVFPGVEVTLDGGHLLMIGDDSMIDDLDEKANKLNQFIINPGDYIKYDDFINLFQNYNQYLLIPHYQKDPKIKEQVLEKMKEHIYCGEVQSPKKWCVCKKDINCLVPVIFSDSREFPERKPFPISQTFIDCEDLTLSNIKLTLSDRTKVFLNDSKDDDSFQILSNGFLASNGLNVVIGKRSSGKTYTLETINKSFDNKSVKYIKQFELVNNCGEEKFTELLNRDKTNIVEEYLMPLKKLMPSIINIDLDSDFKNIDSYITSLIDFAKNTEKNDIYSKAKVFNEEKFNCSEDASLNELIISTEKLLANENYKAIINKYILKENLYNLYNDLIVEYRKQMLIKKLKDKTDEIVGVLKSELGTKSALNPIEDIDFKSIGTNLLKINTFNNLIGKAKPTKKIYSDSFYRFEITAFRRRYKNIDDLKTVISFAGSLKIAFGKYDDNSYEYLRALKEAGISEKDLYRALFTIDFIVMNDKQLAISGGEKAEYNLLNELKDAYKYDILLIDEPEAAFDNIFINANVKEKIKEISENTTVFLVTHNNTLGTLINPNKIIYTENIDGQFELYSGELGSKKLVNNNGKEINNYDVLIDTMEAGQEAYNKRNTIYKTIKESE